MQRSKRPLIHLLFMIIWTRAIKILTWISFTKVSLLLLTQITYLQKDFKSKFKDYIENSFFVLQLNISSLSKNLESFKKLYNLLSSSLAYYVLQKHGRIMKRLMKTHFINQIATIYRIKIKNIKMVEVLLHLLKINILLKIEMILALIVKQLRVSQLR